MPSKLSFIQTMEDSSQSSDFNVLNLSCPPFYQVTVKNDLYLFYVNCYIYTGWQKEGITTLSAI